MKTQLFIASLLTLLFACNTLRRSSQQYSESMGYVNRSTLSYIFKEDSLSGYWYFTSESPFYYHPDSGLLAQSGRIWQQRQYSQSMLQIDQADSSSHMQTSHTEKQSESIVPKGKWWLYAVVIGLLILYVLRWLRM